MSSNAEKARKDAAPNAKARKAAAQNAKSTGQQAPKLCPFCSVYENYSRKTEVHKIDAGDRISKDKTTKYYRTEDCTRAPAECTHMRTRYETKVIGVSRSEVSGLIRGCPNCHLCKPCMQRVQVVGSPLLLLAGGEDDSVDHDGAEDFGGDDHDVASRNPEDDGSIFSNHFQAYISAIVQTGGPYFRGMPNIRIDQKSGRCWLRAVMPRIFRTVSSAIGGGGRVELTKEWVNQQDGSWNNIAYPAEACTVLCLELEVTDMARINHA
jgi:hypothetical protein